MRDDTQDGATNYSLLTTLYFYMYAHDCQQFLEVSERLHLPFVAIRSHAYLYAMLDGEVFNREAGVGIVLYLIKGPLTQLSLLKLFSVIFRGIFLLVDLLKR